MPRSSAASINAHDPLHSELHLSEPPPLSEAEATDGPARPLHPANEGFDVEHPPLEEYVRHMLPAVGRITETCCLTC